MHKLDIHREYIQTIKQLDESYCSQMLAEADNEYAFGNVVQWYKALVNLIVVDPEISKKQLREKIQLFKQMQFKLKAESRRPSGWQNWIVAMKAIIPIANIHQYFAMNGNQAAVVWLTKSSFTPPNKTDMGNISKYKSMIAGMLQTASKGISIMQSKLQMFDEDKAKKNPAVANQNILYKLNTHI